MSLVAKIVPIGTSKGIRLPKTVIEKYHFGEKVSLIESKEGVLLKPIKYKPREGWKEAFLKGEGASKAEHWNMPTSTWDEDEWQW